MINVILTEENPGFTLELKELNLLTYGDTMQKAVNSLVEDIRVYAQEYKDNIQLYSNAPNRKEHIIYVRKVWNMNKEELAQSLDFVLED